MAKAISPAIRAAREAVGIGLDSFPRSVAIIMDGNGRWARARNLARAVGHEAGARIVRKIVTEAANLGLEALTMYSFSLENWKRPKEEVAALMSLYATYLIRERPTLMDNNIQLCHIGRRAELPNNVLKELDESVRVSAPNTGMKLCLALNYSARAEIVDAVRIISERVAAGKLAPEQVDEATISGALATAGIPDPDLLIRTAGELRVSNFLLWQISYAEFYVSDVCWPDFTEAQFHEALRAYAARDRRLGGLDEPNT